MTQSLERGHFNLNNALVVCLTPKLLSKNISQKARFLTCIIITHVKNLIFCHVCIQVLKN
jgi:hypothetical protein